jgi:ferrochelatase
MLIGFGGPTRPEHVKSFLDSVLPGVMITKERYEEVLKHYEHVGNVSPYNNITYKQRDTLEAWLRFQGYDLQVGVSFRHSFPSFKDGFQSLKRQGIERIIAFVLAPFRSHASYEKYQEKVAAAQEEADAKNIRIDYTGPFYDNALFIEAAAARVDQCARDFSKDFANTFVLFSAHSIPTAQSDKSGYAKQFEQAAALVAKKLSLPHWSVGYQSRSGLPTDPWLGPDVKAVTRGISMEKTPNVLLVPLGFLSDNVEILYDLDVEVKDLCAAEGLHYFRSTALNDQPKFIEMIGRQVLEML